MTELYAFLFSLGLGLVARILYIGATALARRTNLLPVTVVLDTLTALSVGTAFTVYVIATGTPLAPYMFAALFAGYLLCYFVTKKRNHKTPDHDKKSVDTKKNDGAVR